MVLIFVGVVFVLCNDILIVKVFNWEFSYIFLFSICMNYLGVLINFVELIDFICLL